MAKKPTRKSPGARKPSARRAARPKTKPKQPERVVVHTFPKSPRPEVTTRVSSGRAFPIELDPKRVDETLGKIREELSYWAKKGRYTKVRFKFRGKQLLPDIPLAAVIAAEGLTFYWGGILRALLVNFAGRTLLNVELVNDAEKRVQRGKEELLSGDVDKALASFREAIDMDRDNANAHLNVGIALKIKGDVPGARTALQQARSLDPDGPVGAEAERVLASLPSPGPAGLTSVPPAPLTSAP